MVSIDMTKVGKTSGYQTKEQSFRNKNNDKGCPNSQSQLDSIIKYIDDNCSDKSPDPKKSTGKFESGGISEKKLLDIRSKCLEIGSGGCIDNKIEK